MKTELYYAQQGLGIAWKKRFAGEQHVSIIRGDLLSCSTDAIVSPANSFGFMDGGIDLYISEKFGWQLQEELQRRIASLPECELLVGRALVVETGNSRVPYLISAPTMRVPMSYGIAESVNAYLATKAIMLAAIAHPAINSVAIPGLCTGTGGMPFEICALQMHAAYLEVVNGKQTNFPDYHQARAFHKSLNPEVPV